MRRSKNRPTPLLDIIGRTDTRRARSRGKGPYSGPLSFPQSCSHPSGNLRSNSSINLASSSATCSLQSEPTPNLFLFNQLNLLRTNFAININSLSVISLYLLFIINSFGCGTLRGGITLKYDEVASEGKAVILECEKRVVESKSQEKNSSDTSVTELNTTNKEHKNATKKTIPPQVEKAIQK